MAEISKRFDGQIVKIDHERRLVTAIASVVSKADGSAIVDAQDDVIEIGELERAFNEAFAGGGLRKGGEMHEHVGGADIVQAFTVSKAEWKALGEHAGVDLAKMPELGLVKLYVRDDALWARVKAGELGELSIAGTADREAA